MTGKEEVKLVEIKEKRYGQIARTFFYEGLNNYNKAKTLSLLLNF